jgi:hypothetical protein
MPSYIDTLRRTLDELREQRRHIDADIEDLQRIIARHGGTPTREVVSDDREPGRAAPPGEGRRHTLELMSDGTTWTASKLGVARGTTRNAARAMLRRLAAEDPPPIRSVANGGYRIVSHEERSDTQGSLSVDTERDNGVREGVDDVVSRAPA